jgi:hypothetical protein
LFNKLQSHARFPLTMVQPHQLDVPVQVQKIKNGVPMVMEFIPAETTASEEYGEEPTARTSKALLLLYLNSKHEKENKEKGQTQQKLLTSKSSGRGDQLKQSYGAKRYNRIVFFADLLNPGKVVCKILETHADSVSFFANMAHGGFGVGWCYVIEE